MGVNITAAEINELRQQTGAGMMDCRKALVESNGDLEKAIDYLRKKGQKVASARSDRETKEGVIVALTNNENTQGVIVCLSCETDFVAKNEDFVTFAKKIAQHSLTHQYKNIEELKKSTIEGKNVADLINEQVAKIGEKIDITKYEFLQSESIVSYIHGAYRIGVLVCLSKTYSEEIGIIGKDLAMQIAAMNPVAIDESQVAKNVIEREQAIILEQIKADPKMAGKPEAMLQKIAEGKLNAFFKENTLLAQVFVKDPSKTVAEYIKIANPELKVKSFSKINLG